MVSKGDSVVTEKGGSARSDSSGATDEEIYNRIVRGDDDNTFLKARAELLLQDARGFRGLHTPRECLSYLGARFRMVSDKADSTSDEDVGHYMIQR